MNEKKLNKLRPGMLLVAIGVVYGDIGTSPMYVMKSVIGGNGGIGSADPEFVLGSLSLVIWTITLLTTVKYVAIAMKADNRGEGGIFSLYSLVKKYGKHLVWPAMIGGAALLADGVLTPAVTVTTAVEGLKSIPLMEQLLGGNQSKIVAISLLIIAVLFSMQRLGTSAIGRVFGPVMTVWFLFLGAAGAYYLAREPWVLAALNPLRAAGVLVSPCNKKGLMLLGSVFLAATGAEALYSDMGHVGKSSIYFSWPFVKLCLILNYLGQGAWLITHRGSGELAAIPDMNPFFEMLPGDVRPAGVLLGTAAAVIASQALISGSFTLVSEAIRLDLMPHMQIVYPSKTKGQLYIALVNTALWTGCSAVILYFRTSARMEAAYGLAITVTMLMTTVLLTAYLWKAKKMPAAACMTAAAFGSLELVFFGSSLGKFWAGGYVAVLIALCLFVIMAVWDKGTEVEELQRVELRIRDFIPELDRLRNDGSIPKKCENMVFLTKTEDPEYLDRDILYSILDKDTKRADAYWFVHIHVTDEPYTSEYHVETFGTDFIFHVRLNLGFKINQRINVSLRQIVGELTETGELPPQKKRYSIYSGDQAGSFKFCLIRKTLVPESRLPFLGRAAVSMKYGIRHWAGSPAKWYGLENSGLIVENVPLFIPEKSVTALTRI